jgi:hypothetical protein
MSSDECFESLSGKMTGHSPTLGDKEHEIGPFLPSRPRRSHFLGISVSSRAARISLQAHRFGLDNFMSFSVLRLAKVVL